MKLALLFTFFILVNPLRARDLGDRERIQAEVTKILKKLGREEIVNYSRELVKKEFDLLEKEKKLEEERIKIEENRNNLRSKVKEFRVEQQGFLSCIYEKDNKGKKKIQHMVKTISKMKADAAANILSVQDPKIAIELLSLLDPSKVSKIFNKMKKEDSARLQKEFLSVQ